MTDPQPPRPEARFGGWVLIVIGGLLVLLCGGCTLTMWGVGLFGLAETSHDASAVGAVVGLFLMTLLIGGLPAVGGAILVWAGWRVLHPLRTPKDAARTFE